MGNASHVYNDMYIHSCFFEIVQSYVTETKISHQTRGFKHVMTIFSVPEFEGIINKNVGSDDRICNSCGIFFHITSFITWYDWSNKHGKVTLVAQLHGGVHCL